jgi:hypothetical protein
LLYFHPTSGQKQDNLESYSEWSSLEAHGLDLYLADTAKRVNFAGTGMDPQDPIVVLGV